MLTKGSNSKLKKAIFFHTLIVIASTYILLPGHIFSFPHNGLDPSWMIAINMAVDQNLVFGRDFVFTFGPMGFLYTGITVFIPKIVIILFHAIIFGAIIFILNFYLQQIKTNLAKAGFFLFTLFVYIELFSEKAFLLLLIFLFFVYYHLHLQKMFALIFAGFIALLTFFVKLNTGLLLSILLIPYLLFVSYLKMEKWRFYAVFLLVYSLLLLLFSYLLNVDFFAYITNAVNIINNYNDAVNIPPLPLIFLLAVLIILAFGIVLMLNAKIILKDKIRIFRIIYVSLAFFVLFKEGFVRADGHVLLFFGKIVPLIGMLYFFETDTRFKFHLKYYILIAGLLTTTSTQVFYGFHNPLKRVESKVAKIAWRDVIFGEYEKRRKSVHERHRKFAIIPDRIIDLINDKTVDIIPTDISYIYFNNLNYNPRPSIQSYASYTEKLDEINAVKYASETAPDFIMYAIGSIDNRHPFWDESKTKMIMLTHYLVIDSFYVASGTEKTSENEDFILLERGNEILNMVKVKTKTIPYHLGDTLHIDKSDNLVYLHIDFKYTFIGKMMRLFFQPNRLAVEMWYENFNEPSVHVAIKPILKGGVLINKKVTTLEEAKLFFQTQGIDNPNTERIRFAPKYGYKLGLKENLEITLKEYMLK
jgi:hypothetical protein